MLVCNSSNSTLLLRTPSGTYPVASIDYADPHLIITDPSMWTCPHAAAATTTTSASVRSAAPPFSLDTSTRFSLSSKNDFLFFGCDPDAVIVAPKPNYCDRFPDRCDSACDSAAYLCRNLPGCPDASAAAGCCGYNPKASQSTRMMLRHCRSYASVYWRTVGGGLPPYDQVPEYGVRVDFEIPVTTRCLQCRDTNRDGGGLCGFDTRTRSFLCLCQDGNATAYCPENASVQFSEDIPCGSIALSLYNISLKKLVSIISNFLSSIISSF
ncbi:hypothetical protein ACMD2_13681 [Ananas comosus]|uniref:Wall-associated receptor kinase C-terminal domain-containing protein n=1 Tax=Ananas comosus TaxID=4615 RepID=A0A199W0R6_ANACO|nr:hypothetical protein ACMD2_13681 [Ananas comosus]